MKIRAGFVSNSSSSSFMLFGAAIDEDEAVELLKASGKLKSYDPNEDYLGEVLEEVLEDADLESHNPTDSGQVFVGLSWDCIGDDETGKQFRTRVESLIEQTFGKKFKCRTHQETWYDG